MVTIRKTPLGGRFELDQVIAHLDVLANAVLGFAAIANGTTAGRLKTTAAADFRVDGQVYSKAATDDQWSFAAEVALGAGVYRAYWLFVDAAGVASIQGGTAASQATAALALADLPYPSATKSVFGAFVAGPSTVFTNALSAQGTIYHGVPAGASRTAGPPGYSAGISEYITLINP